MLSGLSPAPARVDETPLRRVVVGAVPARVFSAAVLLGCIALVLGTQLLVGAYSSEPAHYADEPAHFLNGLLVRDYLTTAPGSDPWTFAVQYYLHFPKIAPGVWGPVFDVLLGLFLMPGWPAQPGALVLIALATAATAWRLYSIVSPFVSRLAACSAAALYVLLPMTIDLSSAVMLDTMVALFAVEGAYRLARFAASGRTRDAVVFGIVATLCCLTKGNGIALLLTPAMLAILTRRYGLLAKPGLYVAAAIVLLVATPFLVVIYRFDAAMGDFTATGWRELAWRAEYFCRFIWTQLSPPLVVLAALGAWHALRLSRQSDAVGQMPAALLALALGGLLFHLVLPLSTIEGRYVTMTVAAMAGLVPLGVMGLLSGVAADTSSRAGQAVMCGALLFAFMPIDHIVAARKPLGYRNLVTHMASHGMLDGRRILVVADSYGEGALVAEVATRSHAMTSTVIRGSKLLVESNWMGDNLTFRFRTPEDVMSELEALHVDFLVMDESSGSANVPEWSLARQTAAAYSASLEPVYSTQINPEKGPVRPLTLYRLTRRSAGPPKKLRMFLRYSVGEIVER